MATADGDSPSNLRDLQNARRELDLLRAILDLLPDFFYIHDADMRYRYANRAAADYFGLPKDQLIGRLLTDVEPDPEQGRYFRDLCQQILREGKPRLTDGLQLKVVDGSTRWLRQHDIPFTDPSTGAPMLAGISRDVTADRRAAEERIARERAERELEVARDVQRSILPRQSLEVPGFDIAGLSIPSYYAAGDFYDWHLAQPSSATLEDPTALVCLGDVSGHGIGPALLASACRAFARAYLGAAGPLESAVAAVNTAVAEDVTDGRFITFAAARLSGKGTKIEIVSAGHGPIVLVRAHGSAEVLTTHGPPLGVLAEYPFDPATTLTLRPGDTLIALTDGIHESFAPTGEQFGLPRLLGLLVDLRSLPTAEIIRRVIEAAISFSHPTQPADDMTAVAIRSI